MKRKFVTDSFDRPWWTQAATALVAGAVCATTLACSTPSDTRYTRAFLERFDRQQGDCIRKTMKAEILDGILAAMLASETAVDPATKLTGLAGCAPAPALRRGAAHFVVEGLDRGEAPLGIGAGDFSGDVDAVRKRMKSLAFDIDGRSRYRGVKRSWPGRYRVAYGSAGGGDPTHEFRIEDVAKSGVRPEGWSADDVLGSMVLEAGPASVEAGRDGKVVWAVFPSKSGDDAKKVVWAAADGAMLYTLEGGEDEFLAAIVSEFAATKGS